VTRYRTRMTVPRAAVLQYLYQNPQAPSWSYRVAKATRLDPGQTGRILARLEADGLATSWWGGKTKSSDGPRRHWFRLTLRGMALRAEVLTFLCGDVVAGPDPTVLAEARARGDICAGCTRGGQCSCCGLTHSA